MTSSRGHLDASSEYLADYNDLVRPEDPHQFLRIPSEGSEAAAAMLAAPCTLSDLGISVSTGRVVDFRARGNLRDEPGERWVPLIYPANLRSGRVEWPRQIRKAQAFAVLDDNDQKALLPSGCYVLVKRFSAKEERRRIVAAVWDPEVNGSLQVAFENHLNVFHESGHGLTRDVAYGLSLWLNSTATDEYFRTFSGHTQVNATDLRTLRFPGLGSLRRLSQAAAQSLPAQGDLDRLVEEVLGAEIAA